MRAVAREVSEREHDRFVGCAAVSKSLGTDTNTECFCARVVVLTKMDVNQSSGDAAQGLGCRRGYVANLEVLAHASDAAQCQEHSRRDDTRDISLVVVQNAVADGNDGQSLRVSLHHWDEHEGVWRNRGGNVPSDVCRQIVHAAREVCAAAQEGIVNRGRERHAWRRQPSITRPGCSTSVLASESASALLLRGRCGRAGRRAGGGVV